MGLRERMKQTMAHYEEKVGGEQLLPIERSLKLESGINQTITVKQYDNLSRVIKLSITHEDDTPIGLSDGSVYLICQDNSNYIHKIEGIVSPTQTNVVSFTLKKENLTTVGELKCEVVKVVENDYTLSFPIFTINVVASIYDDNILKYDPEYFQYL